MRTGITRPMVSTIGIDNKSHESILGVELGFKADDYGLAVAQHLIAKKVPTSRLTMAERSSGLDRRQNV